MPNAIWLERNIVDDDPVYLRLEFEYMQECTPNMLQIQSV